jgi:hypothetical protein
MDMRSFLKFPKNDHVSTHPQKKKHMDFEKTAFQKKMADSIFCVIMSVMEGLGFIDRSVNSQGHPKKNRPSCRLCASEGKHLPKKVVSNHFREMIVTILNGFVEGKIHRKEELYHQI